MTFSGTRSSEGEGTYRFTVSLFFETCLVCGQVSLSWLKISVLHSFRIHLLDFFFVGSVGHYLKEHKNNQGCGPTRIAKNLSATGVDEHCWLLAVVAAPSLPIICTLTPETSVEVAPGDIVRLQR